MRKSNFKDLLWLLVIAVITTLAAAQDQASEKSKDKGPSYEDTVKWIQDHIGEAGFPARTDNMGTLIHAYDDESYSVKFDGCEMRLSIAGHAHTTDTAPAGGIASNDMTHDSSFSVSFSFPLGGLMGIAIPQNLRIQDYFPVISSWYMDKTFPAAVIRLPDTGAGTFSSTADLGPDVSVGEPIVNKPIKAGFFPLTVTNAAGSLVTIQGIEISYGRPGTEDAPKHMSSAIYHLIELCKENPSAGPKDLF